MVNKAEWELEAFLTGDYGLLLDGLMFIDTFQSGGHTVSYEQAKAYLDDYLAQPYNQDMAAHFKRQDPSWAKVLKRKDN